jgi:hypothetical protein
MLKGCQKKILFVEGNENSPFETAYFVLRKELEGGFGDDDIVRAADLIINERLPEEKRKQKKKDRLKRAVLLFLSGMSGFIVGGGTVAFIALLA